MSQGDFLEWVELAALRGGIGAGREDSLFQYLAQHSSLRGQNLSFKLPWQTSDTELDDEDEIED